jgi:hypothetical protein
VAGQLKDWWQGVVSAWHYGRGVSAYKHGRYAEAVKRFRMSAAVDPTNQDTKEWLVKSERAVASPPKSPKEPRTSKRLR